VSDSEHEYEDEQVLATVTVVEHFDPDSLIHGKPGETRAEAPSNPSVSQSSSNKPDKPKKPKPKVIKYQTKAARKTERSKQRARKVEKASLAGGKFKAAGKRRGRR
jgi:ribosomal RNA-processing protein 17